MDLPLKVAIEQDLSALKSRPAQVRAVVHQENKVWAPKTVEDIRLRSSTKAHSKDNSVLLVVNLGTLTCKDYSSIIIERVLPANIQVDVYAKH